MEINTQLEDLLIGRFISRPDVVAIQFNTGNWSPYRTDLSDPDSPLIPWSRDILRAHLVGTLSVGHYLLDVTSRVKLIAFDIDLSKTGYIPTDYDESGAASSFESANLREVWHDRSSPHRPWLKAQMRYVSHKIAATMYNELEIPIAVAYSGNKGMHVYGFTDTIPAADARIGGELIMQQLELDLIRGSFEYGRKDPVPDDEFSNFTIELFPKQDTVDSSGYGNLMAMPLGKNLKNPADPKMFIDLRAPLNQFVTRDPIEALSTAYPWAD